MDMPAFNDAFDAWNFLYNHQIFAQEEGSPPSQLEVCLNIEVVKVNPENESREDDAAKNTATRVWLECGPWIKPSELDEEERKHHPLGESSHDIDLDCGGSTFEEALCELARLVFRKYNTLKAS